jgi:hypothetical protein
MIAQPKIRYSDVSAAFTAEYFTAKASFHKASEKQATPGGKQITIVPIPS